ncbi:hypothetical protein CYMTET_51294 [Cymbomonas tetramitiformis]|uniref:Uncharacterized protein n=1 Tax=Cymbomonas tetramitiformis TaxID=36881 RepID=A0AAE0ESA6_9CHLO|nr:hypothetical protein CYMTET_51294 [Cymbomonas tetramitiformis]
MQEFRFPYPELTSTNGWPKMAYFNSATGYRGKPYTQKTSKKICDELMDDKYMAGFIEEIGSTTLSGRRPKGSQRNGARSVAEAPRARATETTHRAGPRQHSLRQGKKQEL